MQASLNVVQDFLGHKRFAMAGLSRNPKSFSAVLFKELCDRGYDVAPVNPNADEIGGRKCFARIQDIQPSVDAALLMTSPEATDSVVHDCAEAGVKSIWMYRATGRGAVSEHAVAFCQARGMQLIAGECPLMFLPDSGVIHHLHGFVRKITGRYPLRAA